MIYKTNVLNNIRIHEDIYCIKVKKPEISGIKPGVFFNIKTISDYPLLRRPISVGLVEENTITFFIRRLGKGTSNICETRPGELLEIMGPLGNGFDLKDSYNKILIVGGGIGVAPLLELAKSCSLLGKEFKAVLGFKDEAFLIDEYSKYTSNQLIVSEERNEYNYKGNITNPLTNELENNQYDIIYTCGPKPMLKAVATLGKKYETEVQLLMEEKMACGIGACLVCACKVKKKDDWTYLRTCKEGPVFYGREVIFDE